MGGFRRFLMFVFSVAGILTLVALGLAVVGPWTSQAQALFAMEWYLVLVGALACITLLGLLVNLVRSFVSKRVDSVRVKSIDGGVITVTRDSIASQAARVVESDGTCSVDDVTVRARRNGKVRVNVRVLPRVTVDVLEKGRSLHDELALELKSICGDRLGKVDIEFLEPAETMRITRPAPAADIVPAGAAQATPAYAALAPQDAASTPALLEADATEAIAPDEME